MSKLLQQGQLPQRRRAAQNPDAPSIASNYETGRSGCAMPSEAFQYNIVYEAFKADKEFWELWRVVDCARNSPEQSICHGSATIRVVMDLPTSQRLFPTAYTPGFPTLPFGVSVSVPRQASNNGRITWVFRDMMPSEQGEDMYCSDSHTDTVEDKKIWCQENPDCVGFAHNELDGNWRPKRIATGFHPDKVEWNPQAGWGFYYIKERTELKSREPKSIHGLPAGYSVALEVYILDEARVMLAHQRSFRGGKIDDNYVWLDQIVRRIDGDPVAKPEQRAKRLARPKNTGGGSNSRPESELRPAIGSLSPDCGETGMSEEIKSYSDLYGDAAQVMKHVAMGKNQTYAENAIISAFGDDVSLPKPEVGSWSGPLQKSPEEVQRDEKEGQRMDAELDALLAHTEGPKRRSAGMLAGRLDRS